MNLTYKHTAYACYLTYITSAIIVNFAPMLFVSFQNEFGLNLSKIAALVTLNFIVQMSVDFFGAKFIDKIGYRKSIIIANSLAAAGLALLGVLPYMLSNAYAGLLICVFIYAVGGGMIEVMVSPMIEALPSKNKSARMSFLHSFYSWGHAGLVIVCTIFFNIFGVLNWRYLSFCLVIFPLLSILLFTKVPIKSLPDTHPNGKKSNLWGQKIFWVCLVCMMCAGAAEQGVAQWVSLFAETGLGVSKTLGDLLGTLSFAVLMGASRLVFSKFGSKVSLSKYLMFSGALCIISYLLISLSSNVYISLIGCGLCGIGIAAAWPGVLSLSAEKCFAGGTAMFGYLALAGDVGCFTGPEVVAVFSEVFSINSSPLKGGMLAVTVFSVIFTAIMAVIFIKDRGKKRLR